MKYVLLAMAASAALVCAITRADECVGERIPITAGTFACVSDVPRIATYADLKRYDAFLDRNPAVKDAIGFQNGKQRDRLHELLKELEKNGRFQTLALDAKGGNPTVDQYREIHLRKAAWSLYLELNHKVPWSITSYSPQELKTMLGFDELYHAPGYVARWSAEIGTGTAAPWLRGTQSETLAAMGGWVRQNVVHMMSTESDPANYTSALSGGHIGSCHNTGDLMTISALALNIPAHTAWRPDGHRYLDFPAQKLALMHNDDFYNRGLVKVPPAEIFVKGPVREKFLADLSTNPKEAIRSTWLEPVRTHLRYPDDKLAMAVCEGRKETLEELYEGGMCHGNCPKLSDYSPDVEKIVDAELEPLRKKLVAEHFCR